MWESGSGRKEVFPWGNAQRAVDHEAPAYAVGDRICNSYQPPSRGTVVSVDEVAATMGVKWDDGSSPIIYPMDATYLRKGLPWE